MKGVKFPVKPAFKRKRSDTESESNDLEEQKKEELKQDSESDSLEQQN